MRFTTVAFALALPIFGCGGADAPTTDTAHDDLGLEDTPAGDPDASAFDDVGVPDGATDDSDDIVATDVGPDLTPDVAIVDTAPDAVPPEDTSTDADMPDGGDSPWRPLPTGTARLLEPRCPRGSGPLPGAQCEYVAVECPGLETRHVELRIASHTGDTPRGLVVFQSGNVGGAPFTNAGDATIGMFGRLRSAGFTVVERMWSQADGPGGWFPGDAGLPASACRFATVLHYLETKVGTNQALCAVGNSGGSAELGLALTRYDGGDLLDHAILSSGPFAVLADACGVASAEWTSRCQTLLDLFAPHCAARSSCSLEGPRAAIDLAYGDATPCTGEDGPALAGGGLADAADARRALPIEVDFVFGRDDCGGTTAHGLALERELAAGGTTTRVAIVDGAEHQVHGSEAGAEALEAILLERCVAPQAGAGR